MLFCWHQQPSKCTESSTFMSAPCATSDITLAFVVPTSDDSIPMQMAMVTHLLLQPSQRVSLNRQAAVVPKVTAHGGFMVQCLAKMPRRLWQSTVPTMANSWCASAKDARARTNMYSAWSTRASPRIISLPRTRTECLPSTKKCEYYSFVRRAHMNRDA